jgi:hypothetical protein
MQVDVSIAKTGKDEATAHVDSASPATGKRKDF